MKADYNRRSSNGDTLLHTAITMQNVKMVRMLLDIGVDHSKTNRDGVSAKQHSLIFPNTEIQRLLMG